MHSATLSPPLLHRQRYSWLVRVLFIWLVLSAATASAQISRAYYSTTGSNGFTITQPSPQVSGSGTVTNGGNASDVNFSNFAVLRTDINVTMGNPNPVGLRLQLTGVALVGYSAEVLLANATTLLSLTVLPTVKLRTYLSMGGAAPTP